MGNLSEYLKRKRIFQSGQHSDMEQEGIQYVHESELDRLKNSKTKTAKRKLRRWEQLLSQGLARVVPEEEKSEEAIEEDNRDAESDLEEFVEGIYKTEDAYETLLRSMAKAKGGEIEEAYKRRRREMEGHSDDTSEGDTESDDGSYENDASEIIEAEDVEEDGDDAKSLSGSDSMHSESDGDENDTSAESSLDLSDAAARASNGYAREHRKLASTKKGLDGCEKVGNIPPCSEASRSETDLDRFNAHFDRILSDDDVVMLASSKESSSDSFADISPDIDFLQAWLPSASLQATERASLPKVTSNHLTDFGVRPRLVNLWREMREKGIDRGDPGSSKDTDALTYGDFTSRRQRALFSLLSSYVDILYPCRKYPTTTDFTNDDMDVVLLHALNHIAKTSDIIKKNNEKLRGSRDGAADAFPRDQGFARPKVLFLTPMRNSAYHLVMRLLSLALRETRTDSIQRKERFQDEFGPDDDEEEEKGDKAAALAGAKTDRELAALARKPPEHRALFHGNVDDHFRLGIKLTRGAARLFTDFYDSDILVCSPLALATKLEEPPKEGAPRGDNVDYLSSIELVVIDRADAILMQNWKHLQTVMDALNQLPTDQRGVDIMRVKEWYLTGQAELYRQTVVMSSFASAEMIALIGRNCKNHAGAVRLMPRHKGVLGGVVAPGVRLIFERLPLREKAAPATVVDARFEHFKEYLWPRVRESVHGGGQLIYVPSYFDYVRVRNFLRSEGASFVGLCEYTDRGDMARARAYFADGRRRVLLYTERAQFYNRHRIRGIKDILFYQLPDHPQFYLEVVNWIEESGLPHDKMEAGGISMGGATVCFSKFDALKLERVVGSDRARLMLRRSRKADSLAKGRSNTGTFMFC